MPDLQLHRSLENTAVLDDHVKPSQIKFFSNF